MWIFIFLFFETKLTQRNGSRHSIITCVQSVSCQRIEGIFFCFLSRTASWETWYVGLWLLLTIIEQIMNWCDKIKDLKKSNKGFLSKCDFFLLDDFLKISITDLYNIGIVSSLNIKKFENIILEVQQHTTSKNVSLFSFIILLLVEDLFFFNKPPSKTSTI